MSLAILGGSPLRTDAFQTWPVYSSDEEHALIDALRSGLWGGYGEWVQKFEKTFGEMHEVKHAISCSNGTVALEVALRAMIDEVSMGLQNGRLESFSAQSRYRPPERDVN